MADQELIKQHYNKRDNKSIQERNCTRNINIRLVNNAIKTMVFKDYLSKGASVLDLGFGKGGDLLKYCKAGLSLLYGIDIADRSILDAIERVRAGSFGFKIILKAKDAFGEAFSIPYRFDVISVQFAFHYAFETENKLERAVDNIHKHLKTDGIVILSIPDKNEILKRISAKNLENEFYSIRFKNFDSSKLYGSTYYFSLIDSIDSCLEYLVDQEELNKLMFEKGMALVEEHNFRDYLTQECMQLIKIHNSFFKGSINEQEEDVVSLYKMVIYRKQG
ncbi:mRNA (guanine-N7-)-methyltransferase [Enteropsectra breve]|nr:mRNA (guanine-N7-)-methyltransferase [Enteropsectra breve]